MGNTVELPNQSQQNIVTDLLGYPAYAYLAQSGGINLTAPLLSLSIDRSLMLPSYSVIRHCSFRAARARVGNQKRIIRNSFKISLIDFIQMSK